MGDEAIRNDIIETCRWLAERAFVAADDGAVSARLSPDRLLITPRGASLDRLSPAELISTDLTGQNASGEGEPSPAVRLHLAVYTRRDDIQAVVHAQPPATTAFAIAGIPLVQPVLPETVLTLGTVPLARYATPFTATSARAVEELIGEHDAALLKNRGMLCAGVDLEDARQKLDRVEKLAEVLLKARSLDHIDLLSGKQVEDLMDLRNKLHLPGMNPWLRDEESEDA